MRAYAQDLDDSVLMKHVELYVNDWTVDLGTVGLQALYELSRRSHSGNGAQNFEVFTQPSADSA